MPSPAPATLLLCVLSWLLCPGSAFFGIFSSSETAWDPCSPDMPAQCSCTLDLLQAMEEGLVCAQKGIQGLRDDMVIPVRFRKVDFSGNNLTSMSRATFSSNNTQVTDLNLAANGLPVIEASTFTHLPALRRLDLSNNVIKELNKECLEGLSNLTLLNLGYNRVKTLPDGLFSSTPKLEALLLMYNPISVLQDTAFRGLHSLKHLDLTYMRLSTLHSEIFYNMSLERLELVHNSFEDIPTKALYQLAHSLRHLDLSGNEFETISAYSLYNMSHLEELRLEQMVYLRNIEAFAFDRLSSLKTLVFRYLPKIRFLDEKAFSSDINGTMVRSPVQDFTFSYSILNRLPEKLLDWDQLKFLDLHYNKWTCDCKFAWVKGSAIEALAGNDFYCSSPMRVRGAMLSWLKEKDFTCNPGDIMEEGWRWGVIALLFMVGIMVSLTTVSVLFYRRNGYLCRAPPNYNKLTAVSTDTITVVDNTAINTSDVEINQAS